LVASAGSVITDHGPAVVVETVQGGVVKSPSWKSSANREVVEP